jgi:hypothetical protein
VELRPLISGLIVATKLDGMQGGPCRCTNSNQANDPRPQPGGTRWNASTINGNAQPGIGIIFNDLYAGRIVWNKVRMVKNPDTGKRLSRPSPREEWRVVPALPCASSTMTHGRAFMISSRKRRACTPM